MHDVIPEFIELNAFLDAFGIELLKGFLLIYRWFYLPISNNLKFTRYGNIGSAVLVRRFYRRVLGFSFVLRHFTHSIVA